MADPDPHRHTSLDNHADGNARAVAAIDPEPKPDIDGQLYEHSHFDAAGYHGYANRHAHKHPDGGTTRHLHGEIDANCFANNLRAAKRDVGAQRAIPMDERAVGRTERLQAPATTEAFSELVAPRFGGRS